MGKCLRSLIVLIPIFWCCIRIAQPTFAVCFVPGLEFCCQGCEHFLLDVIHAAPVKVMLLRIFSDREPVHKPLLEIFIIVPQHGFEALLQEDNVFRHSGKFCLRHEYILFLCDTKLVLPAIQQIMLTQILSIGIVSSWPAVTAIIIFVQQAGRTHSRP